MSGPDRLKAELKRNPDYLRAFRESCEDELEIELEKLGIVRVSDFVFDYNYAVKL